MAKKKEGIIPGIILIAVGFCLIVGLVIFAFSNNTAEPDVFVTNRAGMAEKLYNSLMDIDFVNAYPATPEEVVDVYNNTVLLLYGDMIISEDVIKDVLNVQRELLTKETLEINPLDEQFASLAQSTKELYSRGIRATDFERGAIFYSTTETDVCTVPIKQILTNQGNVYWNYYLTKVENSWKIFSRKPTDENYKPL